MTVNVSNTQLNDSFNTWRLNTNYISTIVSNNVVTVSRSGTSAERGGSVTGDGHVEGTFSSTILRTDKLKSGNTSVAGGTLLIESNTHITGTGVELFTVDANTVFNANVTFNTTGAEQVDLGDVSRIRLGGGAVGQVLRVDSGTDELHYKDFKLRNLQGDNAFELNHSDLTLSGGNTSFRADGDSPHLLFSGGNANTDVVSVFLAGAAAVGDSDLYLKLVDAAGDSKLVIADSSNTVVATIDTDGNANFTGTLGSGNATITGTLGVKGNTDLDGTFEC